jgi:hypothetical protein
LKAENVLAACNAEVDFKAGAGTRLPTVEEIASAMNSLVLPHRKRTAA